jgi:hypothetical protein
MRGERGLVRLRIVGVVVSFGVYRVIPIAIRLMALVSFIVSVGIVNIFNRILASKRLAPCACARNGDTHSGLIGEAIARGHGQVPCRSVGIILELVGVQGSGRRGGSIGIAGDMGRVHHGLMMFVPKWIWSVHGQLVSDGAPWKQR